MWSFLRATCFESDNSHLLRWKKEDATGKMAQETCNQIVWIGQKAKKSVKELLRANELIRIMDFHRFTVLTYPKNKYTYSDYA